jgi:filamentous hemagglutinin
MRILPNAERAVIPTEKFTEYALNPDKDANKAKAFKIALGYDLSNYGELIRGIRNGIKKFNAVYKGKAFYGHKYEIIIRLSGPNGRKANVLTGWLVNGDNTRMVSAYVTNKATRSD